jgi:1-acyl-sn-glycerol-3-phosphate acyltransferase
MADIKPQVYKDPRPAEYFTQFHDWTRTHRPGWVYDVVRIVFTYICLFIYRTWALGTENVPETGPVILAPNHFSNIDHFFSGVYIHRRIQFMAKSQLFGKKPILTYIYRVGGVFPIRRGHRDEEAFTTAETILGRGGTVLIYPEGGRSRDGRLGDPKAGLGRLALESGAPVVPMAIHGSLGVRKWRKLRFPKVTVQYGEPITFAAVEDSSHEQQLEASKRVFDHTREMYVGLEEKGRRGVAKALREGVAARAETKLPAGQPR